MRTFYRLVFVIGIMFALFVNISHFALPQGEVNMKGGPLKEADWFKSPAEAALNEDHSKNKNWIRKYYGPNGNYENSGFAGSARKDFIEEGTKGKLTQPKLSTIEGLKLTQNVLVRWDKEHGGVRRWEVFEINPANSHNMNRGGPVNHIDTYGIIVIKAPEDMKAVMSPAHDDHAQIWINGEKWYNNSHWTGAPREVDYNIEIELQKGGNVLVYRCSEKDGTAYMNLHFDDKTHAIVDIYPDKAIDQRSFFEEIAGALAIDPIGKLATTWGDIKRK